MWFVQVTHKVACLARWMAADLYLREIDVLRFELSQNHASDEVPSLFTLMTLLPLGCRTLCTPHNAPASKTSWSFASH